MSKKKRKNRTKSKRTKEASPAAEEAALEQGTATTPESTPASASAGAAPLVRGRIWAMPVFVVWLGLSLLGALDHNLISAPIFGEGGKLPLVLPHLKYGYVMYNEVPPSVPRLVIVGGTNDRIRTTNDLIETPAPLYKASRIFVNTMMYGPVWLEHVCSVRPSMEGVEMEVQILDLTDNSEIVNRIRMECSDRRIRNVQ